MDQQDLGKTKFGARIFFWLFAILALFLFLGRNGLWGSENRWAEITREMMLSNDYLHPSLNWRVYFDKPLLTYWLIVPFARLLGGVTELASRIPSALAALAALYGMRMLGKKLFDGAITQLASFLLLTGYGFLFWGRSAAADMANLAAIILATAWFFEVEEKATFWKYFGFYLICFAGALCKGLPALVMPFVIIAPWLIREKRFLKHLKLSNFAAFFLAGAIYFIPFYFAATTPLGAQHTLPPGMESLSGLELVWRENIVRVFAPFDHKDPIYSYLYNLPRILAPWTLVIGVGLAGMIRNWKSLTPKVRDLMIGTLLMFILFSLSGSRRWYYILPLMPFVSLLGAAGMLTLGVESWNRLAMKIMYYTVIVLSSLAVASLMMLPLWTRLLPVELPVLFLTALPLGGILALLIMLTDNFPGSPIAHWSGMPRNSAATVLAGCVLCVTFFSCIIPSFDAFRTEKTFFRNLQTETAMVPPESILFWLAEASPTFVYYTNLSRPVSDTYRMSYEENRQELEKFLRRNQGKTVWIFSYSRKRELEPLRQAVAELNLPLKVEEPNWREPSLAYESKKSKKWVVWSVDLSGEKK